MRDVVLARTVVVKVITGDDADDPTLLERFRREARAGARIDSEHVVKVYEARRAFDSPFIVMQHIHGVALCDVARARGALSPGVACALALGVARGLAAAHAAGIVHRDVKPANARAATGDAPTSSAERWPRSGSSIRRRADAG